MPSILDDVRRLVAIGQVIISEHAKVELENDEIRIDEVLVGVESGDMIEEYPSYSKGPCALVLQRDTSGRPLHALWGIRRGTRGPAVLVTVYRPDPSRWSDDFRRRQT